MLALNSPLGHCHVLCLPPPKHSIICNTNLADNEDDKKRRQLSPARADETDNASEVTRSLPHQSARISPHRDICTKLRSEIEEVDVRLMNATKLHCCASNHHYLN